MLSEVPSRLPALDSGPPQSLPPAHSSTHPCAHVVLPLIGEHVLQQDDPWWALTMVMICVTRERGAAGGRSSQLPSAGPRAL
eukprot:6764901-Pyramimonas_sp.AAC.1